jgi:hypothetical protein
MSEVSARRDRRERKQDNPSLPPNSTVYVESDESRRQSMNDLRTWIGSVSTIALLALRLGG